MRPTAIAMVNALPAGHDWSSSAGDLAIAVAAPLLDRLAAAGSRVDALFCAAPAGLLCDGQAGQGAVFADRLGLTQAAIYQLEAGDASGAAALHAAVAHVAAGMARVALVLAVAKVSDRSERERAALMDALIDREVEAPLGLSYQALCGLLADLYVQRHGVRPGDFAHVCAKNAGNAVAGGESFLPHAPSALEIRRDIPVAPPLVRSDFAPLFDGATALIVTDLAVARELGGAAVEIVALAAAADLSVVSERSRPLHLDAAARATAAALARVGSPAASGLAFLEVSSNATILEVLALESIGVCDVGSALGRFKDGLGKITGEQVINPGGGAQGRGLAFGNGGLEQAREAYLQLSDQAGKRQVGAARAPGALALALCLGGLGSQAFATVFRRPS